MADLQILSTGSSHRGGLVVVSSVDGQVRASARAANRCATISLSARAGETPAELGERARRDLDELERVAETIALLRPRQLDGEDPDPAVHWVAAGFVDAEVVAWLEAGVPWSTAAQQLRDAGVTPREVGGEYEPDITLGLAFALGAVDLDQVLELRRPAREVG